MRDTYKVDHHSDVSARDSAEERDLKCGTGDAKKDGYSVVARRPRSAWNDDMVSAKVADDYESMWKD